MLELTLCSARFRSDLLRMGGVGFPKLRRRYACDPKRAQEAQGTGRSTLQRELERVL